MRLLASPPDRVWWCWNPVNSPAAAAAATQHTGIPASPPSLAVPKASDSGRVLPQFDLWRLSCSMLTNWPQASPSRREHKPLVCLVPDGGCSQLRTGSSQPLLGGGGGYSINQQKACFPGQCNVSPSVITNPITYTNLFLDFTHFFFHNSWNA